MSPTLWRYNRQGSNVQVLICGYVQACEWTANCTVDGCANKCQVHSSVGMLLWELNDRNYRLDGWNLCPELAFQVEAVRRISATHAPVGSILGVSDSSDKVLVRASRFLLQTSWYQTTTDSAAGSAATAAAFGGPSVPVPRRVEALWCSFRYGDMA